MTSINEIAAAISAHALWKARLRQWVTTGHVDPSAASNSADRACDLGKWLQSTAFTATGAESIHYAAVKEKHVAFHKVAARVARLALLGQKEEAERMLSFGGDYSVASAQLTAALLEWKSALSRRSAVPRLAEPRAGLSVA